MTQKEKTTISQVLGKHRVSNSLYLQDGKFRGYTFATGMKVRRGELLRSLGQLEHRLRVRVVRNAVRKENPSWVIEEFL